MAYYGNNEVDYNALALDVGGGKGEYMAKVEWDENSGMQKNI